jgi:hypothetical protein
MINECNRGQERENAFVDLTGRLCDVGLVVMASRSEETRDLA